MLGAMDAADLEPHAAAKLVFTRLHAKYSWIDNVVAEAVGGGWDIFIIASKHKVYDDYDISIDAKNARRENYNAHQQQFDQEIEDRLARGEITPDQAADLSHYNQHTPGGGMSVDDALERFKSYNKRQKQFEKELREMDGLTDEMREKLRQYNDVAEQGTISPASAKSKFEAGLEYRKGRGWVKARPSPPLSWGPNSRGHLIKHRDVLGYSHITPQQAQRIVPQLEAELLNLYGQVNPALTRMGRWHDFPNAMMFISRGKMIVTDATGTFITVIGRSSNNWYRLASPW